MSLITAGLRQEYASVKCVIQCNRLWGGIDSLSILTTSLSNVLGTITLGCDIVEGHSKSRDFFFLFSLLQVLYVLCPCMCNVCHSVTCSSSAHTFWLPSILGMYVAQWYRGLSVPFSLEGMLWESLTKTSKNSGRHCSNYMPFLHSFLPWATSFVPEHLVSEKSWHGSVLIMASLLSSWSFTFQLPISGCDLIFQALSILTAWILPTRSLILWILNIYMNAIALS